VNNEKLPLRSNVLFGAAGRAGKMALSALIPLWQWLRRIFAKDSAPNLVLVPALFVTVAAAGLGVLHTVTGPRIEAAREAAFFLDAARSGFDGGGTFSPSALGENIYEVFNAGGEREGFFVRIALRGMGGPVHLVVHIGNLLEVHRVQVVSHRETGDLSVYKERAKTEALALFEGEVRP
jgi:hypothetical protein